MAKVIPSTGNPVVYGEKIINSAAPTVLVYGHYDVMPVDPLELWHSAPFEPEIRDGKIFARGADDDKGQCFIHAKAFEYLVQTGTLPCNVKFMIEGEEEIGSAALATWCSENKDLLKADVILVSDTMMLGQDTVSITCGLRGIVYFDVEVTGANRDLHSGNFGGAVANPVNILAKMIASLHDGKERVTVKGFYDDVKVLTDAQRAELNHAPFDLAAYKQSLGIENIHGEEGYTTIERIGIRPTLDVCGIWGGYTGEGAKTVIPSAAFAKISMRLVPNQEPEKTVALFADHFKSIAPDCVKVKVTYLHGGNAYVSPVDSAAYHAATKALETTFGQRAVPVYSGGSIPVIATFERALGLKSILLGFGRATDATHSPNENFPLTSLFKGIETVVHFYGNFAEMMRNNC
jgi:acetylornithine deacetylase/succinyl-diaminopimelate desuccinylase-like protein